MSEGKTLVTGSAGYVASRLVPLLRDRGHEVVGIDRRPAPLAALARSIRADLLDPGAAEEACAGVRTVVHLAAARGDFGISDAEYHRDNVEATRALLRAGRAAGVRRWVFFSSVSAMGPSELPLDEGAPRRPVNAYGRSKAGCEEMFHALARDVPEAEVAMLRPSVIFGPGNPPDTNIHRLIETIRANRFVMIGRGEAVKTTSYIDNVAAAALHMLDGLRPGAATRIYVDEPAWTTGELVARLYALLGKRGPALRLPLALARPLARVSDVVAAATGRDLPITAARIEKFCTATRFDASAIRRDGFVQPVSMDDAVAATVRWYLGRAGEAPAPGAAPVARSAS